MEAIAQCKKAVSAINSPQFAPLIFCETLKACVCNLFSPQQHFIGNEEVMSSILIKGLVTNALLVRLLQIKLCCSGYFCYVFLALIGAVLAGLVYL
jgi:hypothetical protein